MQSEVMVEQAVAYEDECLELLASAEITTARVGSSMSGMALVARAEVRQDRAGRDYAALALRGKGGRLIDGRWWQFPLGAAGCPAEGSVWWFVGAVDIFSGCRQMRITDGHTLEDVDLGLFVRSSRRTLNELCAELEEVISLLDEGMAAIVREALASPVWERFSVWPAVLLHSILAHHGRREWGAPCEPATIEANLVHLADLAESQLWDWSGEKE